MRILVTGGSRGIGAEAIKLLRRMKHDVDAPPRRQLDMSSGGSIARYLARNPRPDAVLFSHGEWYSIKPNDRGAYPLYHWMRQYDMRVVLPMVMIDRWLIKGDLQSVVMVSSTRGFIGGVNTGPYAAACAAQIALMQGYAREHLGCRFNCLCPGWTDTAMGTQVLETGGVKIGATPQSAEFVARVVVDLLLGKETGEVIQVAEGRATRAYWTRDEDNWP